MRFIRYVADQALAQLQRWCQHPGDMVAVDLLEGSGEPFHSVRWCRRCGAVGIGRGPTVPEMRLPDPNLWRGFPPNGTAQHE